ncbi:hypothetical protein BGX26_000853 [Mortierella sp. AD094]|nr:hypothetical protein BGX26_000853 [Mortierella sp. AD094]
MNVVHRDLKLGNLLYKDRSENPKLMVVGFGASKALNSSDQLLTEKCGSPGYTAPEVASGHGYGKPIDLWSIGIVTYTLLTGDIPSQSRIDDIQSEASKVEDVGSNAISLEGRVIFHHMLETMNVLKDFSYYQFTDLKHQT